MSDDEFNTIYPDHIQKIAHTHFTPVDISKISARLLSVSQNAPILDIGAGAGKFCSIGSVCTDNVFVGVEHRLALYSLSLEIVDRYRLKNVEMIHSDITEIPFGDFKLIYFFNSFSENIAPLEKIDDSTELTKKKYIDNTKYVKQQLETLDTGTKILTYYSTNAIIPENYQLKLSLFDCKLKVWERM